MTVQIASLQVEHHESGFGIDSPKPRLSWRFTNSTGAKDWKQAKYEMTITRNGQTTSEEVEGDESVLVPWIGKPLVSRERVELQVRAKGNDGNWTEKKSIKR